MKRITLLPFLLLAVNLGFSQITCQQSFTASGADFGPTTLTISRSDLTCSTGDIIGIKIKNVTYDETDTDIYCDYYYSVNLTVDGQSMSACPSSIANLDITNFEQLTFTSADIDDYEDTLLFNIVIELTFNTSELPLCDAVLTNPIPNSTNNSVNGKLSWNPASFASGYKLTVGTENGLSDILNNVDVGNTLTHQLPNNLNSGTTYFVTIKPYNGNGETTGTCEVFEFTTCEAIFELNEGFDELFDNPLPNCWNKLIVSTNLEFPPTIRINEEEMYINSGENTNDNIFAILPPIGNLSEATHRLHFKAKEYWGASNTLHIGVLSNINDPLSFQLIATKTLTNEYAEYFITIPANIIGKNIAFKHGIQVPYSSIVIDNIKWEVAPQEVPSCLNFSNVILDENCGNYTTKFTWDAAQIADGYKISIGTTPGTYNIVDNLDVNTNLFYNFQGNYNTTYYYVITPYNTFGEAIACEEQSFSTNENGCYCISNPTSLDNQGITNVRIGSTNLPITPVTYTNLTETQDAIDIARGTMPVSQISFATQVTYYVSIWVDLNNDYQFTENEVLFHGEAPGTSQYPFNTLFTIPIDAPLGIHRVRIAAGDFSQFTPTPCYSGAYGITIDFNVNITEAPDCLPINSTITNNITNNSAKASWTSNSTTNNYKVEIGPIGFETSNGTIYENIEVNEFTFNDLTPNTTYEYYVSQICATSESPQAGPFRFTTICDPIDNYFENFTTYNSQYLPNCWSKIISSTAEYPRVQVNTFRKDVELHNSTDTNTTAILVSPLQSNLGNATHRVKFKARGENERLIIGIMTDKDEASTFVPLQTIELSDSMTEYTYNFTTPNNSKFIGFKHGNNREESTIVIDDFYWGQIPTSLPLCVEELVIETNDLCGNSPTKLSWINASDSDSYKIFIGSQPGTYNIINGNNIGDVNNYQFSGSINTTYYVKVVPVNHFGEQLACEELSFTTLDEGCYCTPKFTALDNQGIVSITANELSIEPTETYYSNMTQNSTLTINAGDIISFDFNMQTSSETNGQSYNIYVWIDYNNNFVFDENEKVYSGLTSAASPTNLNAEVEIIKNNNLVGQHRIRIIATTNTAAANNPCYDGYKGETVDFMLNIQPSLNIDTNTFDQLKVYPNPANSIINIDSNNFKIDLIEIYNLMGQKVLTKNTFSNTNEISIDHLTNGTYFMKIYSQTISKTVKIIKQ